jgi:hypothetical protein
VAVSAAMCAFVAIGTEQFLPRMINPSTGPAGASGSVAIFDWAAVIGLLGVALCLCITCLAIVHGIVKTTEEE